MRNQLLSAVGALTPMWQHLLHRNSIGAHEDFFELGGSPETAIQLFEKIALTFNRQLSPLLIYQAPTIAALASLLDRGTPPRLPPLIPLKSGASTLPIFVAHGMGGSVMEFFDLVKQIQLPFPIYGLQAKGSDGAETPLDTIEGMAEFHLEAVRNLQPHGPYIFVGHSLGGLVAFEMAARVSAAGEQVALLAMLDSYLDPRLLSFGQRARVFVRRAKHSAARRISKALHSRQNEHEQRFVSFALAPSTQRVRSAAQLAFTRYQPNFYPGEIKFVRAAVATAYPDNPTAVWGRLASRIEIETAPGDHNGMLQTATLAGILSRYIKEATCHR